MRNKESRDMDDILYQALKPCHEPGEELNRQVLQRVQKQPDRQESHGKYRRAGWAAKAAALLLMLAGASGTVYAAWQLYTAEEVARHVHDRKLARAFHENAEQQTTEQQNTEQQAAGQQITARENVQSYGGYRVTLLGVASGKDISDYPMGAGTEHMQADRTYAAVAIQREDGSPMAEDDSFFVSPLIQGYDPMEYNAVTMRGAASFFEEDGVLYWLVNCSNVEYFADHTIYLCVTDTDFYRKGLYNYDEADGSISRIEDYDGLNALFELELDASKADPAAALVLLEENREATEPDVQEEQVGVDEEISRFLDELTMENFEEKCVLLADTCQTMMPDEEGQVYFEYSLPEIDSSHPGAASAGGTGGLVDYLFRSRHWGDENHSWTCSSGGDLPSLEVCLFTLNEDGSVSFGVYVPRDVSIYLQ